MTRLFSALALSVVIATASVAGAADQPGENPYYPLKIGTTWVYKTGTKEVTIKVTKHEKVGEVVCAVLETNAPNGQTLTESVGVTKEGICRFKGQGMEIKPPLLLLPLNPKKGDRFTVDSKASGETIKGTFTIGQEDVTVPAGKYKAITTHCDDLAVGPMKWSITYWFAPNVGMVKQEVKVGSFAVVLELTKSPPGSSGTAKDTSK